MRFVEQAQRWNSSGWGRLWKCGLSALAAGALAALLTACGGSKSSSGGSATTPAAAAASQPGTRQVVIPTDSNEITLVVPPCPPEAPGTSSGQSGGSSTSPASTTELPSGTKPTSTGANRVVLPKGSGIHTVLISPCVSSSQQSGGSSGGESQQQGPPGPNTLTLTPGVAGKSETTSTTQSGVAQVVVPKGSNAKSVVVPACAGSQPQGGGSSGGSGTQSPANVVLPADSPTGTLTAPNCAVPPPPQ